MQHMGQMIFKNMVIDNSELDKNSAIFLTGLPGHFIEDILISDVMMTFKGGGSTEDAERENLPEYTLDVLDGWWPEFHLVGTLPASGIYARHIKGLSLENIHMKFLNTDERPSVVLDDVPVSDIQNTWSGGEKLDKKAIIIR